MHPRSVDLNDILTFRDHSDDVLNFQMKTHSDEIGDNFKATAKLMAYLPFEIQILVFVCSLASEIAKKEEERKR